MPETPDAPNSSIVLYTTEDGTARIQCRFDGDTVWLTQALMAELFQVSVPTINEHLRNIVAEGELPSAPTIRSFRIVRREGSRDVARDVEHYRLEMILAVGYRVRSQRGTQFRQWATARLGEFLKKGFTMDDERLKNPPGPGVPDYFDELLERIRDIRASERRVYLRVRDILALAADYAPAHAETQQVFAIVQNKLLFAATGRTAPELIVERVDATKPNMGLTTWKGDVVRRPDVTIAKNYLREDEIDGLNRLVVMFLDFAEDNARRRKQVFLADWRERLDQFLEFNERDVLPDAGDVSREDADGRALAEFEAFAERRRRAIEDDAAARLAEDALRQLDAKGKAADEVRKKARKGKLGAAPAAGDRQAAEPSGLARRLRKGKRKRS